MLVATVVCYAPALKDKQTTSQIGWVIYFQLSYLQFKKTMEAPIVIIGIGELAGVFAKAFLRCGYPVYPVTRGMNLEQECLQIPSPELVLVTVQENQLHSVLEQLPELWRNKVGLLQNELLPRDWQRYTIENPTVTVIWFEK